LEIEIGMAVSEFAIERTWQADRRGAGRWIFSHALRYKWLIFGVFAGALGNAAVAAASPMLVGRAFDAVSAVVPDLATLRTAAILIASLELLRGTILQMARNLASETLGQRLERDIRDELYASLIGKSMSFHDSHATGDLMARATNDVREINLMFAPGFNLVIGSANFIFLPLFVAPTIHPQLVLVPVLYLVTYGFVVRHYLRELQPAAEGVRREFGKMNTTLVEPSRGRDGQGRFPGAVRDWRFQAAVARWRDAFLTQADIEARFVSLLLLGLLQMGGLLHSLLLFRSGAVGVGDVIGFNGLLLLFGFPTWAAQFAYSRVASGMASARRLLELINARTELDQNTQGYAGQMRGEVTFEHVIFCYNAAREGDETCENGNVTLEDLSFHVAPGQTVAIVGQTGSGKSTLPS
jgi:ATP-binding cassette subfamily B protein